VDDVVQFVFRQIRTVSSEPYRLTVGDQMYVRSMSKPAEVNTGAIVVQPDGMITLPLVGQVSAAGYSVAELRDELETRYGKFFQSPEMVVTPVKLNTRVQDFLDAVDRRFAGVGGGGQQQAALVLPDGTISLPAIGSLCAQGLTVPELGYEVNERYGEILEGVTATPALFSRAPRYLYVLGEVAQPGRYELHAPTTVSQAIGMAGSWSVGANLRHVIILRRGEDWSLMGCAVNMNSALNRRRACPHNDMWLADSDVVIVLKGDLIKANNLIEQVFTRGIYSVFPLSFTKVVQ
jgi:polysaccharide export outer membrane protein